MTITAALAETVASALLRAVTVTLSCEVVVGAAYRPEVEIVPTVAVPPTLPLTSHVTLWSVAPETVVWNCCVDPAVTVSVVGAIEIVTGGGGGRGFTVTVALADFVESALLRAVTDRAN